MFIGGPILFLAGVYGMIYNAGKLNQPIANISLLLIPLAIIIRIIYIVWLRKVQFYVITNREIRTVGGVLNNYSHTVRLAEIRSVSYTRTL